MHSVTKHIVLVQWNLKCCKVWASIYQIDSMHVSSDKASSQTPSLIRTSELSKREISQKYDSVNVLTKRWGAQYETASIAFNPLKVRLHVSSCQLVDASVRLPVADQIWRLYLKDFWGCHTLPSGVCARPNIPACPAAMSSNCSASLSKKDPGFPGSWCWYVGKGSKGWHTSFLKRQTFNVMSSNSGVFRCASPVGNKRSPLRLGGKLHSTFGF